MVNRSRPEKPELALLVDSNITSLSALQDSFTAQGVQCVVSRDLVTALLALTHEDFSFVIINVRIKEQGDGLALAGLVRKLLPKANVAITCIEKDVLVLQSAINSGLNQVFDRNTSSDDVVRSMLAQKGRTSNGLGAPGRPHLQ